MGEAVTKHVALGIAASRQSRAELLVLTTSAGLEKFVVRPKRPVTSCFGSFPIRRSPVSCGLVPGISGKQKRHLQIKWRLLHVR